MTLIGRWKGPFLNSNWVFFTYSYLALNYLVSPSLPLYSLYNTYQTDPFSTIIEAISLNFSPKSTFILLYALEYLSIIL